MPIIDEKPRPRALLMGFNQEEIDLLRKFFPTLRAIGNLSEVREAEWDVLLTKGTDAYPSPHLYVLAFGLITFGWIELGKDAGGVRRGAAEYGELSRASEFIIPDELDSDLARLVSIDVLPHLRDEAVHRCLGVNVPTGIGAWTQFKHVHELKNVDFKLFVGTPEPRALAGCFVRAGGKSESWLLPFTDLDAPAWVEVALRQWHKVDPDRFPVDLGWERAHSWRTPVESELAGQIESIRKERKETLARLESMERELAAKLHAANVAADAGERLLLTAQDEPLVGAVANAFRELGFQVQDMDAIWPSTDRREDLRLSLPERGGWLAICEVKGYYKGAKVSDLFKVERFRSRFFKEVGRDPDRCFYVVNSFINDAPSSRKKPLPMNSDEVETFAEGGGLVVGTVDLFRLLMDVRRGKVDARTARALLADTTGVLSLESK